MAEVFDSLLPNENEFEPEHNGLYFTQLQLFNLWHLDLDKPSNPLIHNIFTEGKIAKFGPVCLADDI